MDDLSTSTSGQDRGFYGHPRGLGYLFFAELWERFSFYGMRALLTLYMVERVFAALDAREVVAATIYAAYGSMVYAFPVLGGRIADTLFGYRRAILLGGTLMAIGHFIMAIEETYIFFIALSFIILGNGFFKPNISTFVGSLYADKDMRRSSGFTIFYMGINMGAALAPLLCGYLGRQYGWHYGFSLAGIGMLAGLIVFWTGIKKGAFQDKGMPPNPQQLKRKYAKIPTNWWIVILSFASVPLIAFVLQNSTSAEQNVAGSLFQILGVVIALYLAYLMWKATPVERQKLFASLFLILCMTLFWGFFELQGSSLTLFAQKNVQLWGITASQTNAINPIFIILLSIPMAWLWTYLSKIRANPYSPYKFGIGLLWLGFGFYILVLSKHFVNDSGQVPFVFLILSYFLISTGELFMSPVGLSKMTELSPKRIAAFMMGVWFLSSTYAFQIVGFIARGLAIEGSEEEVADPFQSLAVYAEGFEALALVAAGAGVIALIAAPFVKKLMHEVH